MSSGDPSVVPDLHTVPELPEEVEIPNEGLGKALNVFGDTAPAYFEHDMPVIPLDPMKKSTTMKGWNLYHDRMPDEATKEQWLKYFRDGNIGLVLGVQSGVVCIDIDTEDNDLKDAILNILPPSPWCKIGKKGMTLGFKYNGTQSFRIRARGGGMLVEHLSSRTQTVLPPSIHPDTMRPYVENVKLYEVKDQLVALPLNIEEQLRSIFTARGIDLHAPSNSQLGATISVGSRDVTLTTHAGAFALLVLKGERSLVDAANQFRALISTFVENAAGDPVDPEKHIKNMVMFLRRDVLERNKLLPKGWDAGLTDEQKIELGLDFGMESLEWNSTELIAYLRKEFETHPLESPGRVAAINSAMTKMASSKSIKDLEKDQVLGYIKQASGTGLTLPTLRKNLKDLQTQEVSGINHAQIATQIRDEVQTTTDLKFFDQSLWKWNGSNWEKIKREDMIAKIIRDYGDLPAAKRWSDHNGIYNTLTMLVSGELSDTKTFGVNFRNGFLTRDMVLHEHHPSFGMTYTLPYDYAPENSHRCVKWLKHLETVWGDDPDYMEKVECLRDVMCVTMFGLGTRMQRAVLLYGLSHTGKSQIMKVMEGLMHPSAVSVVPPKSWGDRFSPSQMLNKLLNVCGELGDKETIHGPTFKMIVAGDRIEAQFKNQQTFSMLPTATHWFSSNCIPKSDDDSKAFNRRWIVLCFNKVITDREKVDDYGEVMLEEEREAICAWVMESAHKFQKTTIPTFPKSHERFIYEMANLRNSVRMFLMDSGHILHHQGDLRVDEASLHQRYWSFCVSGGAGRPVSQKFFRTKAREFEIDLGFKIELKVNPITKAEEAEYVGLTLYNGG